MPMSSQIFTSSVSSETSNSFRQIHFFKKYTCFICQRLIILNHWGFHFLLLGRQKEAKHCCPDLTKLAKLNKIYQKILSSYIYFSIFHWFYATNSDTIHWKKHFDLRQLWGNLFLLYWMQTNGLQNFDL